MFNYSKMSLNMFPRSFSLTALSAFVLFGVSACGSGGGNLSGAGASFPNAIYTRWFQEIGQVKGVNVAYQSIGSGAGVQQFIKRTVDFAASDIPMKAKEIGMVKQGVVQVPMTAGAIAVAYHNQNCDLKLTQAQLADVFLGKINNWQQLGCGAKPIKVVFRSDGSGTTANFTAHLAAISKSWQEGPGQGKSVSWPTGIGAKGNEGVAAQLGQLDGSISYVEAAYVKKPLQAAALTNASGVLVKPTAESEIDGLASIDLGADLTGSNPNPAKGYPIVTFTWVLLYKTGNGDNLKPLQTAFDYALSDKAQQQAPGLGYVSLPPAVANKAKLAVASIQK